MNHWFKSDPLLKRFKTRQKLIDGILMASTCWHSNHYQEECLEASVHKTGKYLDTKLKKHPFMVKTIICH